MPLLCVISYLYKRKMCEILRKKNNSSEFLSNDIPTILPYCYDMFDWSYFSKISQ